MGQETSAAPKPAPAKGTKIVLGDSEFGTMLFGADKQAIYIFENDPKGKTVCYGECAEAWPPVFTDGKPQAGDGVKASLLGTVKRNDGKLQVTYNGQAALLLRPRGPGRGSLPQREPERRPLVGRRARTASAWPRRPAAG